ncbi:hypothetical protein V8C44DRAFT_315016 [Trichoderma aethiopicum]
MTIIGSWLCLPCELWLTPHRSASCPVSCLCAAYVTPRFPHGRQPSGTASGGTVPPLSMLVVTLLPSRLDRQLLPSRLLCEL